MDHSNVWAVVLAGGEGTRVRGFLKQLCGGSGLKQFSAIIGERSMLRCTLDRVERLIPRDRILIVVTSHQREEAERQLANWPRHNIIVQPSNRDTAPGILLPLAHVSNRDPGASVVVFPSDHFVIDEDRFMRAVASALNALVKNPGDMILLGITPQAGEETEYGYIVGAPAKSRNGDAIPVAGFVEKPPLARARQLIQRGALWNAMVFAVHSATLWDMVQRASPELYHAFRLIQLNLRRGCTEDYVGHIYDVIPMVNFSSRICEPLASRLRVLPVDDVGWSDWGTVGSIVRTMQRLGRFDTLAARMAGTQDMPSHAVASGRSQPRRAVLTTNPSNG